MSRGQLFSSDALLSMVVFLFALTVTVGLINQLIEQSRDLNENNQLNALSSRLAQSLIFSPGFPSNWEYLSDRNQVQRLGLTTHGKEISSKKLSELVDWNADDYSSLQQKWKLGEKDFFLTLTDVNKNVLARAGIAPVNAQNVSVVILPVVYRSELVLFTLQVYES